ncbi:MAG: cyclic 2,3-diphosphoglycerate synthase [Defluviitaleaceae bacterium]|nr:cyclic 2,3-diphosphoglycerate synthase [Defluviitaleaceae bacterium]
MKLKKVIIIGAAGRDFHNFNTFYRENPECDVVAFTATQIPDIAGRSYPKELAGSRYPNGIPIYHESELEDLIKKYDVDYCVFSYSDVSYEHVMGIGAKVNAAGAAFSLLGYKQSMLKSTKKVVAVGAVRTGCGKSQTSRKIVEVLNSKGLKVIAVRHPMPYGDLNAQKVQRFASLDDLKKHNCTIEEMEEYEPHIASGNVIYAGVDYAEILKQAENDPNGCDIILWDGGNNDFPFYKPDLMVTVTDPHRPGHELSYYPGEVTLRIADVVVINKIDSADFANIQTVRSNIAKVNPNAIVIDAASTITVDSPEVIKGKRVLAIEDGPTLTHGEMKIGAGIVAAHRFGASEIIDPRAYAVGRLRETYETYPNIGTVLPAMGYGEQQVSDLAATIDNAPCESVIVATPIDLARIIKMNKPNTRVTYALQEIGSPTLDDVIGDFLKKHGI